MSFEKELFSWTNTIPKDWKIKKIKHKFDIYNGATPKSDNADFWDGDIMWVTPADYSTKDIYIKNSRRTITQEGVNSCATKIVGKDSIVVSNRAPIGAIAIAEKSLCTNQGCKSLVPDKDVTSKYYYYYLSVQDKQLNILGKGTTFLELSTFDLSNYLIPFPISTIQNKIANYLDEKTAKIQLQIEKAQKIINLLKEKKEALIVNAVTKGIDKDAPLKDSGIDWIGQTPTHWEVKKIKHIAEFFTGWTPPSSASEFYDGDFYWANISDLGNEYIYSTEKKITDEAIEKFSMKKSTKGNILFSFKLSIGLISIVGEDLYTNEAIATFDTFKNVTPKYFYYLAPIFICKNANENIYGAPILNQNLIKNANVVIPNTIEEQEHIVNFIDKSTKTIETIIEKNEKLIQTLKEYQEALITASVTGKIDVRGE
jgi:type I restriction enzyme S subunit